MGLVTSVVSGFLCQHWGSLFGGIIGVSHDDDNNDVDVLDLHKVNV